MSTEQKLIIGLCVLVALIIGIMLAKRASRAFDEGEKEAALQDLRDAGIDPYEDVPRPQNGEAP